MSVYLLPYAWLQTPPGLHPDTAVLRVIQKVLSYGKNARLYKVIQDKGFASRLHVSSTPFKDGGLLESVVYLTPGTDIDMVESIIHSQYEVLKVRTQRQVMVPKI